MVHEKWNLSEVVIRMAIEVVERWTSKWEPRGNKRLLPSHISQVYVIYPHLTLQCRER